jgi:phosphohistidine phosphatase SixA
MRDLVIVSCGDSHLNSGLNIRGRKQSDLIGKILSNSFGVGGEDSLVMSSPALRSKQCGEIIMNSIDTKFIKYLDELWCDLDSPKGNYFPGDLRVVFDRIDNFSKKFNDIVVVTHRALTANLPRYFVRQVYGQKLDFDELIKGDAYVFNKVNNLKWIRIPDGKEIYRSKLVFEKC